MSSGAGYLDRIRQRASVAHWHCWSVERRSLASKHTRSWMMKPHPLEAGRSRPASRIHAIKAFLRTLSPRRDVRAFLERVRSCMVSNSSGMASGSRNARRQMSSAAAGWYCSYLRKVLSNAWLTPRTFPSSLKPFSQGQKHALLRRN